MDPQPAAFLDIDNVCNRLRLFKGAEVDIVFALIVAAPEGRYAPPSFSHGSFESAEVKIHDRRYVLTRGHICAHGDDYELTRFCV